jgi:plastocyanin
MKKIAFGIVLVVLPLILVACKTTNSNVNTVVVSLTNTNTSNSNTTLSGPVSNTNSGTNVNQQVNSNTNSTVNTNGSVANTNSVQTTNISITSQGFSPPIITVKAGAIVTWTNNSLSTVRVASDPHPTHTDLPGLDSGVLNSGASYSFTFTQIGQWGYHDHLSPSVTGKVIVE